MSSVKDELEELRRRSLAKAHAAKLQNANGLSTPEQEQQALKQLNDKKKVYAKDAVEILKAGSKALDQDLEFKVQQKALKKQDLEKKKEAAKNLQSFKGNVDSPVKVVPLTPTATATTPTAKTNATPTTTTTTTTSTTTTTEPPTETKTTTPVKEEPVETKSTETPVDEDVPDLDEIPELETTESEGPTDASAGATTTNNNNNNNNPETMVRVVNRAEKKSRKVMERLGMKPVSGISRVTLKMRGGQGFFTIYQPDVFEKNGSFVVFGEARQGTGIPQMQQQAQAAQKLATPVVEEKKAESEPEEEEQEQEQVDETGVEAKDIELVVSQVGCSRAKAVKALKENDGDLVNAIMSLTN